MDSWYVDEVKSADSEQLGALTNVLYKMWKRAGDYEYYQWKLYKGNRPNPIGIVARANKNVVGYQASCHRLFRFGEKQFWATELGDSMVHPDYRRQGIWETLTARVIKCGLNQKYYPIYGFPNQLSYKGYTKKLSMNHFLSIWRLVYPLKLKAAKLESNYIMILLSSFIIVLLIAVRAIRGCVFHSSKNVFVEKVDNIDQWVDELWEEEFIHNEIGVVKSASYMRWRFDENPDEYRIYKASGNNGKPLGILVTKIREMEKDKVFGFIADIMIPSRKFNISRSLLDRAIKDFTDDKVVLVDAWMSSHRFYLYSFILFGFLPIKKLPFIIPNIQAKELIDKGYHKVKKWVLTMADSDNI